MNKDIVIGVIGLGYVGLPLAVEFGKNFNVFAFDKNQPRMNEIRNGLDRAGQLEKEEIQSSEYLKFTDDFNS